MKAKSVDVVEQSVVKLLLSICYIGAIIVDYTSTSNLTTLDPPANLRRCHKVVPNIFV